MAATDLEHLGDDLDNGFGPWTSSLSPNELAAIEAYQEGWAAQVNAYLRGDLLPSTLAWEEAQEVAGIIDDLENALAKGRMPFEVIVFRGISRAHEVFDGDPRDTVGEIWDDPAFLSTSIDRELAIEEFALEPEPGLLELTVPEGSQAGWICGAGGGKYRHEGEVLLPPLTEVEILEADVDTTGLYVVRGLVLGGSSD